MKTAYIPLLFAICQPVLAQRTAYPFQPPPRLKELSTRPVPGIAAVPAKQDCDPKGSLSRDGNVVSVALHLMRADFTINNPSNENGAPDPVTLRSYGGCKSGPTIEVLPGNTLRVDLINELDKDDPSCLPNPPSGLGLAAQPGVGCFNTTNLHTHGLHVSPSGNSDNVLLNIAPQTRFPYEINIPTDHPAGTYWYHAHRHGSTAVQVASGGAGPLIIRGTRPYKPTKEDPHPLADVDTILHDAKNVPFPEQILLFQQIAYACFDNEPALSSSGGPWQKIYTTAGLFDSSSPNSSTSPATAPWICPPSTPGKPVSRGAVENFILQLDSPTIWDTNGRFTSINGVVQPTMTASAGAIQRWRMIHAGIHDTINLQIVKAVPLPGKNPAEATLLTGNRVQQREDLLRLCPSQPEKLIPQFEIANDGITRASIRTIGGMSGSGSSGSNYLQAGYRSDILIAFPEEGDYCVLDQAASAAASANHGGRGQGPGGQGPTGAQLLAYVRVQGGRRVTGDLETYVRTALRDGNPDLDPAARQGLMRGDLTPWAPFKTLPPPTFDDPQKAHFEISGGKGPPLFQINGKSYDPDVVNITRQVNTVDDWVLTSTGEPHIFHIHVNPFQVMDVTVLGPDGKQVSIFDANGKCRADAPVDPEGLNNQYCGMYRTFRDTVFVQNNYQVHIRTRYDRYIGEFVVHCHILDHEDSGMMLNIKIVPDLKLPGGGLGMSGMKHRH